MKKMFASTGKSKQPAPADAMPCPPDRELLGTHSWTLLHTMAAYFPNKPTAEQSTAALNFIRALPLLYPCRHCAYDFELGMEESPPKVSSREELSVWMCEAHNRVNESLGKPIFKCTLKSLDERWRSGKPGTCGNELAQENADEED